MVYKRNVNEMEWVEMGRGERFHNQGKTLTLDQAYVPKLGVSLFRLSSGKRSFPFHEHLANDEAILVTRGNGMLRYGNEQIPLGAGDYVHLPAASGNAHQVLNTSEEDLEYYCFSSMILPDVVLYTDSDKIGVAAPRLPKRVSVSSWSPFCATSPWITGRARRRRELARHWPAQSRRV